MRGCPLPLLWWQLLLGNQWKNKLWSNIEKVVWCQGNRSLPSMRNFDFKRYTQGPKTVASLLNTRTDHAVETGDRVNLIYFFAFCREYILDFGFESVRLPDICTGHHWTDLKCLQKLYACVHASKKIERFLLPKVNTLFIWITFLAGKAFGP